MASNADQLAIFARLRSGTSSWRASASRTFAARSIAVRASISTHLAR